MSDRKCCRECPFRRASAQGWLGQAAPETFVHALEADVKLPCHLTIDYSDPEWKEKWEAGEAGEYCVGAYIMQANMLKLPRDPDIPREKADRETVFAHHKQFIEHHRDNSKLRGSWEGLRGLDLEIANIIRIRLGLPPLDEGA